jgi:diacylglycerol kinase family enzyme
MTWWVVVNPAAGTHQQWEPRVRRALESRGLQAVVNVSESAEHLRELVAAGVAAGATRFVAAGGA